MGLRRLLLFSFLFAALISSADVLTSLPEKLDQLSLELQTRATTFVVGFEDKLLGINSTPAIELDSGDSRALANEIVADLEFETLSLQKSFPEKVGRAVSKPFVKGYQEIRTDGRRRRSGLAIAYASAFVWEHTAPFLFLAAGQPHIALIIGVLPDGIIVAALYSAGRSLTNSKHRNQMYGGKDKYRYFKRIRAQSADQINHHLSMRKLYKLALANGADKRFIHALKRKQELDPLSKTQVLGHYMANRAPTWSVESSAIESYPVPKSIMDWTTQVAQVKDCQSFLELASRIPENQPARLVARLWDDVVFDYLVHHYQKLHLKMFHRINKDLAPLMVSSEIGGDKVWTLENTDTVRNSITKHCKD